MTDADNDLVEQEQQRVLHETRERDQQRWCMAVQNYVSLDLFKCVQFVNRDQDIGVGSQIQKIVCKACTIPDDNQVHFWTSMGADEVLKTMKRKRQSVTNSIQTQFESK